MTLHHRIATYHGQKTHEGQTLHAYKTLCGLPIVGSVLFKQNQLVAVGKEPHAQCAKCFKAPQANVTSRIIEGDRPVSDPDQGLGSLGGKRPEGAMDLDDKGGNMSAAVEKTEIIGNYVPDPYANKSIAVKKTAREGDRILKTEIQDPMGNIERSDFG